jgi:hypothetical protein
LIVLRVVLNRLAHALIEAVSPLNVTALPLRRPVPPAGAWSIGSPAFNRRRIVAVDTPRRSAQAATGRVVPRNSTSLLPLSLFGSAGEAVAAAPGALAVRVVAGAGAAGSASGGDITGCSRRRASSASNLPLGMARSTAARITSLSLMVMVLSSAVTVRRFRK